MPESKHCTLADTIENPARIRDEPRELEPRSVRPKIRGTVSPGDVGETTSK